MSTETIKPPGKRGLLISGAAALLCAGIIAGYGFISRAQSKQEVTDWTSQQSTPTVSLVTLGAVADWWSIPQLAPCVISSLCPNCGCGAHAFHGSESANVAHGGEMGTAFRALAKAASPLSRPP